MRRRSNANLVLILFFISSFFSSANSALISCPSSISTFSHIPSVLPCGSMRTGHKSSVLSSFNSNSKTATSLSTIRSITANCLSIASHSFFTQARPWLFISAILFLPKPNTRLRSSKSLKGRSSLNLIISAARAGPI